MENKVKVIESDGKAYEISDAVKVYVGINSASVEKSDGTLILIPSLPLNQCLIRKFCSD